VAAVFLFTERHLMQFRVTTAALAILTLSLITAHTLVSGQEAKPKEPAVPVWKADPQLLKQLGPEIKIEGYAVRPPRGYESITQNVGIRKATAWKGPVREDGTAPGFYVVYLTMPPGEKKMPTLEEALNVYLADRKSNLFNWKTTKTERGKVNGLDFVRMTWSGTNETRDFAMHGFAYVYVDSKSFYVLGGQDIEPYNDKTLKLSETAALTFRKP
jgi:hypothetical protein